MKKKLSIVLIMALALSVFSFGCENKEDKKVEYETIPYSEYNLLESVTLPDYYELLKDSKIGEVSVTEEDLAEAIREILEAYPNEVDIFEGKVDMGDTVKISYKGVLKEDGSTKSGMQSDSYEMTLGITPMISGFTEGIVGHNVGDQFDLELRFPDNYTNDKSLSNKEVTFTIKVLSKTEKIVAEVFDDEFVKNHSTYTKAETWKEDIRKSLLESKKAEAESVLFAEMYDKIQEASTVTLIPEAVEKEKQFLISWAENICKLYDLTWEEYIESVEAGSEEQYLKEMQETAETLVEQDMFTYALCQKEGLKMTKDEYQNYRKYILDQYGYTQALFEATYNISIDDYMHLYGYEESVYATSVMSHIYENIEKARESK